MMIQSDYEDKPGDIYIMRIDFEFYSYARRSIVVSGFAGDVLVMIDPIEQRGAGWHRTVLLTATGELVCCGYSSKGSFKTEWARVMKYSAVGL